MLVTKILLILLMGFLFSSFDADYSAQAQQQKPTKTIVYHVKQGDTLWDIGERFYDNSKPFDEWMHDLREANGFGVGSGRKYLHPGEVVHIKVVTSDETADNAGK